MATRRVQPGVDPLTSSTRDPFRGSVAVRAGRVTRARLRGPSFRALYRDVYVGAAVEVDLGVRRRALALHAGPQGVIGGSLAADAHGVPTVDAVAEVVVPGRRRPPKDVRVRADRLPPSEVAVVHGVRVTTPARTAFDLARRHDLADAVAMADALARRHRFGPAALRTLVLSHGNVAGLDRVRAVIALTDRAAESLPESRTRVALVTRGVPPPVLQVRVQTPVGAFRLDMAWPDLRVAVEYDGDDHRYIDDHGRDLDRDAALEDLGWLVIRVTKKQLDEPDLLAARVLAKLAARSRRDAHKS